MKISKQGLDLLKSFESCELCAYRDGGGVWTIGWGHTEGAHGGMVVTQALADEMLRQDAEHFEAGVTKALGDAPTSQCQFDAMVCLAYNIGLGDPTHKPKQIDGFLTSTVLRRHKQRNYIGAANAFLMWVKDGGVVVRGLVRRRAAEARLYRGEA